MAFVSTLDSLYKKIKPSINTRLGKSYEKAVSLTASENTFTVDPNTANMFVISVSSNSSIALSSLTSEYTTTGSVVSIVMTLSSSSLVVSWPNTIKWQNETAPTLSHKNLITLMHFGETNTWYGGSIQIDDNY